MPKPQYEPIPVLDRFAIETAIKRNVPEEVLIAVLSATLYSEDREFAKELCVRLAEHSNFNVRGNALLGLAHISRIDKELDENKVKPAVLNGLNEENEYVRSHAQDAKEDIEHYLGWNFS